MLGFIGILPTQRLFPGKIGEIRDQAAHIYFYNGERGWVPMIDIRPLGIDVARRIFCRWRGISGAIIRWHDEEERFYVRYESGEGDWATLDMIWVESGGDSRTILEATTAHSKGLLDF